MMHFPVLLTLNVLIVVVMAAAYATISSMDADAFTEKNMGAVEALHYAATVHSTVGFGDISPVSTPARLCTAVHSILIVSSLMATMSYMLKW